MNTALPSLMQQALDKAKKQGLLPKNFRPANYDDSAERFKLSQMINSEELFRFAYVPFVIAELVWDYVDTLIDTAIILNDPKTRPLSRTIRNLRMDYNRYRAKHIDKQHHESELENMHVFNNGVKQIFKLYSINIRADLANQYPELTSKSIDVIEVAYTSLILLRALFTYVDKQRKKLQLKLNKGIGKILPIEMTKLEPLIEAFVGDKPISEKFRARQSAYISSLATKMALIGLNELSPT